jgi:ethanolamine utilization protein EutQ
VRNKNERQDDIQPFYEDIFMSKAPASVTNHTNMTFTPRFEYGDQAQVTQVVGSDDGSKLGAGYVRMTNANIPWIIKYDEVILVLEGEMSVETKDGTLHAKVHETIWLPAGTELTYRAESALVFYAIQPSDWASPT